MPGCSISDCNWNERNSKNAISFHRFPKDVDVRHKWIVACGIKYQLNIDNARVCSSHFSDDDFERDFRAEFFGSKPKRILKPTAVPSLRLAFQNVGLPSPNEIEPSTDLVDRNQNERDPTRNNDSNHVNGLMQDEIKVLKEENLILWEKNSILTEKVKSVEAENILLKTKLSRYESMYSKCQQKVIQTGSCSNWSADDVSKAITLRCLSNKAISYVRDTLNYPLPSDPTIKRRLQQIKIKPGFIELSETILNAHSRVFTDFEKDVMICFDEMKVKSELCYDPVADQILGPYSSTQVVAIRGLVGKWKQPVFYGFDKSVDKELFYQTVNFVESAGFKVRGFVCDLGPSNQKLISDLKVTVDSPCIKHPTDDYRHIWCFCDVPHMLKLLRNHLLDDGYLLSTGQIVGRDTFERILESQKNDLKYTYKITSNHLIMSNTERQNVRKAAELLSGTVASAISYLAPENQHVADFVKIVNDGFDVLNSRVPNDSNILKSAYGNHLEEQDAALEKLYDLCQSMRALKRRCLLPFQKGFMISIRSLQGLYRELINDGYSYLMASKCNQDALESFFSLVRGLGRFYDHPLPTSVSQRIKSILLTKNASCVVKSANCSDDGSSTLSAEVIGRCCEDKLISREEGVCDNYINNDFQQCEVLEEDETNYDETNYDELIEENGDVLKVIAGYVAYRVKKKNISSSFVYGYPSQHYASASKDWLSVLSRGGLINPTDEWMDAVCSMEGEFLKFHGTSINTCKNVMKTLAHKIKPLICGDIDDFAIMCFVRTRTFIRMKHMNKHKTTKRKVYGDMSTDKGRKTNKKLNKLT